jgi:hypothetical protein
MLDVTAFSNALLSGSVSYLDSLGASAITDTSGRVRIHVGDDAAVYPLAHGSTPHLATQYALRVPLSADGARSWPERYADLQSETGDIHRFLPADLTILDSDVPGEPELALLYRWIPGSSLSTFLRKGASGDQLNAVVGSLADLADALLTSGLVHGDIAPGNIIVRPDITVALIDLDRMGPAHQGGTTPRRRPGYRLSDASASTDAEDAFGLLVIMASVAAYSGIGQLPVDSDLDRADHQPLLFSSWDLMDPRRSELFRRLELELTGVPALLLKYLAGACVAPSSQAPQILAEAVNDVRRAPVKRRVPTRSVAESDSWNVAESDVAYDTWAIPDEPVHASWPSIEPEERDGSWGGQTRTPPGTGDLLERIAELSSLRPAVESGRTRHRLRGEYRRQQVATELREALASNDRDVLVRLAMSGDIAELGDSDRADLVVVLRALGYDQIARAVTSDQDGSIIAAVDPQIFPSDGDVDQSFGARVRLARERDAWVTQVIEAVRQEQRERCADLLVKMPSEGLERLPPGVRDRAQRLADIATLAADVQRGLARGDLNAIVGPMARLSGLTGRWTALVEADEVVAAIGYSRIRDRVVERVGAGTIIGEDQWLIDCVVAAGDLDEVARAAGKSREELARLIAPRVNGYAPLPT